MDNMKTEPSLDPLRRVFVPIEKRDMHGVWHFATVDSDRYTRDPTTGVIRRVQPKVNGKRAKKARREVRANKTCRP